MFFIYGVKKKKSVTLTRGEQDHDDHILRCSGNQPEGVFMSLLLSAQWLHQELSLSRPVSMQLPL